jgi:prepilin-type N-terminal cleavage/methylation domain-containing protein
MKDSRQAFSLVELSIVLVILGLLTGGILAGQSLIRAAELRSVSTDYNKYMTAVRTFRDKYFAIPGDMSNATSFWQSLGGTGSDTVCQAISATGAPTCNGDGDGSLLDVIGGTVYYYETYRFWQHLANAGLVEGSFTGLQAATNPINVPGVNVAASKISNAFFYAGAGNGYAAEGGSTYSAGSVKVFAGDYGKNEMVFNMGTTVTNTAGMFPLKPEEAWNIDTKLDDGLPNSGSVIGYKGSATVPCTTKAGGAVANDAGAAYNLTDSSKDCYLIFPNTF